MKYRKNVKNGEMLSILGFGCMRLPDGSAGEAKAVALIRGAVKSGVNYFDTAYTYQGGRNESVLGKALAGGLREKVKIATKLPPFMVRKLDNAKKILAVQLAGLRTDRIDYYLLHMLTDKAMFERLRTLGVMEWLEQLKAAGTVKNIGFSFHGVKADFEELIWAYPWDFCQIQYNWMDENNQAGKSGLRLAARLGIPVIVMEPLRGGKLVSGLPDQVVKAFGRAKEKRSPAEWGLRWVWNHPEVTVALSGMNDEAQLAENIRIASVADPDSLTESELQVFSAVKTVMLEKTKINCTACGYCMPCPYGVDIPACFSHYNDKYVTGDRSARFKYMRNMGAMASKPSGASQCTGCGRCESRCTQKIPIRQELKKVAREMEGVFYKPLTAVIRRIMGIK